MNALLAMGRGDVDHSALVLLVEQPGSVEILTQPDLKSGKKPGGVDSVPQCVLSIER